MQYYERLFIIKCTEKAVLLYNLLYFAYLFTVYLVTHEYDRKNIREHNSHMKGYHNM